MTDTPDRGTEERSDPVTVTIYRLMGWTKVAADSLVVVVFALVVADAWNARRHRKDAP